MNKKGFTLIELLATLVLLGMLATLVVTSSIKRINKTKEKDRETLINAIELAAESYVVDNPSILVDKDYAYITLQTLESNERFTNSLIDPTTKKPLSSSDTVYVTRSSDGVIKGYYDINQKSKCSITLSGSYNIYVKKGESFVDPGVTALDSNGNDITSSVTSSGSADVNTRGNYVITYTCDNVSITRNVIVY